MNRACTNDGCACTPNASIKCTVTNCAHHCKDVDNCGLTAIQVGTHESRPHHGPVHRLPELPEVPVNPAPGWAHT